MIVQCARCGKQIEKEEAIFDDGFYLCKECDYEAMIERLPSEHSAMTFKVTKRICKSIGNTHFLTSSYPNRSKDKKSFSCVDGLFMDNLLPGLKANEADFKNSIEKKLDPRQGIEVDVHISRVKQEGWHEMWVFGYRGASRMLTPFKPRRVRRKGDSTCALTKHGSVYISHWCKRDYFPDIPEGEVFPVYMKVTRKEKQQ